ncbi:right-handed parallel beta-helix repeat-containing protein [Rubritalea tangerina]|uniref:right-handed parallel beta-helix repeat-containing protein n=1 Tax=Rubritalea tangerina TaxID=430798 RepID=UPI00361B0698
MAHKYEIYRNDTRTLRFGSYHGCEVLRISPNKLRITKPQRWKNKGAEQVGDPIVIECLQAKKGHLPHAISLKDSKNVTLSSVTLFSSPMFGFIENDCSKTTYLKCRVDRRPLSNDLKKRASARLRSLNADAFHSYNAPIGPRYLQCSAQFQGDDCIAINSEFHLILNHQQNNLRVLARRHMNLQKGDPVMFLDDRGIPHPLTTIKNIQPHHPLTDPEKQWIQTLPLSQKFKSSMRSTFLVTLDAPRPLPKDSLIYATNKMAEGFQIIDGSFAQTRSRGLLIQANNGIIKNNKINACHAESIKVAPEFWWLAAGPVNQLVIANNEISNSAREAIQITSHGAKRTDISPPGTHNAITISNNTILDSPPPHIYATSTAELTLKNNRAKKNGNHIPPVLEIKRCSGVSVDGKPFPPQL